MRPRSRDKSGKIAHGARRRGVPYDRELDHGPAARVTGTATTFPAGPRGVPAAGAHWYPIGPNNIGGRVRALAIDPRPGPTAGKILYAGPGSGGVFKTVDGGETWRPLWHAEASLSIAAIAIAPSAPDTVYVATGEPDATHVVAGGGIFRSTDGGDHWTRIVTAEALSRSFHFEAIAVHPAEPGHVWVAGSRGLFRTLDGLAAAPSFQAFDIEDIAAGTPPVYYSDLLFGPDPGGNPMLYLCRGRTEHGELVRLENPGAAEATVRAELADTRNRRRIFSAPGASPAEPVTLRGKFTLCRDTPDVMYVAFTQLRQAHSTVGLRRPLRAIMRSTDANAHGVHGFHNTSTWKEILYRAGGSPSDFAGEDQGEYNLLIGVSPTQSNHLFFGMQTLFMTTNARATNPTWHPVLPGELWRHERAVHADQHAIVFEQHTSPPAVWIGNDGGVVRCADYSTATAHVRDLVITPPTPPPVIDAFQSLTLAMVPADGWMHWQRRVNGLVATQPYDLTQSPLVPTMYGCGHQDNGVWYTTGGDTWRFVMGADGGFVAWDPYDPYHFLATYQGGLDTFQCVGEWERAVPPSDVHVNTFLWPRELTEGFHPLDGSRFVADTIHHPRRIGRIVTTRSNRPYATDDGERFVPLPVGDVVEVVVTHTWPQPGVPDTVGGEMFNQGMIMLEVVGGTAASALGIFRGVNFDRRNRTENRRSLQPLPNPTAASRPLGTNRTVLRTLLRAPFGLVDGQTLELRVWFRDRAGVEQDRVLSPVVFRSGDFADIGRATAAEVADVITTALGTVFSGGGQTVQVEARPILHGSAGSVELFTESLGGVATLTIGGDPSVLTALAISAGTYHGIDGRPAMVTLQTFRFEITDRVAAVARHVGVPDGDRLTVAVDGGAPVELVFHSPPFANLEELTAGELARQLQLALTGGGARAHAVATSARREVVVFRDDHQTAPSVPATSTLSALRRTTLERLTTGNIPPGRPALDAALPELPEHELLFVPRERRNAFNLTPPGATDLQLRLRSDPPGPGTVTIDVDFDLAGIVDRGRATVDEVVAKIRPRLTAASHLRCEVQMRVGAGEPSELAYDLREPATLWVGGDAGSLFVSPDDGASWRAIEDPDITSQQRSVEAITIDPTDSQVVYVGLGGVGNGAHDAGTLFRTADGGTSWAAIGRGDLVEVDDAGAPLVPSTPLGINEVVIDPEDARRLWVATPAGVFESPDAGASFRPLNEGLPNVEVVDLTYVPQRRMLRAATWGRGVWARSVAAAAPPAVALYVRTSILDDGAVRPADDGLDGFAPAPRQAARWESPDIKVSRLTYADLGSNPDEIDGVEFDNDLLGEPIGERGGGGNDDYAIWVQVHNRSANPSRDTRVIVLGADCDAGVPDLPESLWNTIGDPAPTAGGGWELLGVVTLAGELTSARSRVARVPWTPPDDIGQRMRGFGILALVSSAADTLTPGPRPVHELIETERRAGFRIVPTRTVRDTTQIVLRALDGVPFDVVESGPATFAFPAPAATAMRSGTVATFDATADASRQLVITTRPPPPGTPTAVTVRFRPDDITRLGGAPAACTAADARRMIAHALRRSPLAARAVDEGARLSVRADGPTADVMAAPTALADAADQLRSGIWIGRGGMSRGASNHVYARIRNVGAIDEPSVSWRLVWFDPAAAPIAIDAGHELASGVTPPLPVGGELVVDGAVTPGAGVTHRGILVLARSDGDPLRGFPSSNEFADVVELEAYCARNLNAAYRIFVVS